MHSEKFSSLLRRLIDHLSITQEAMGQRLGVSRNMVSMMLRPDKDVNPSMAVRMHFDREWKRAFGENEENESRIDFSKPDENGRFGQGKICLKTAREALGLTPESVAKAVGITHEDYQTLEDGRSIMPRKISMRLSHVLKVPFEDLVDNPLHNNMPERIKAKSVPVLTMTECGPNMGIDNWERIHQEFLVQNITDPNAFAVTVAGDFMTPICAPGDVAVVSPGKPLQNGALVLARLSENQDLPGGGEAMLKLYHASGEFVTLSNYNLAFPPLTFQRSAFNWIYPVVQLTKTFE